MGFDLTGGLGSAIVNVIGNTLDKVLPDPAQREAARLELEKIQQSSEFKELDARMGAITTEAGSSDPWTSRARPTFMYVFYGIIIALVILAPALGVFFPGQMKAFFDNVGAGFKAIPQELWWTFSAGYLGYSAARSYEKVKGLAS